MSRERDPRRRGRHPGVGGDAAADALNDLVQQFADPLSFVRELIQNSLDAGSLCIDIDMAWADGRLTITVMDDGEGMDQATIEDYLLTLFRSTKEQDLTKIGKFGIGFVSLFAIEPSNVVLDTGRDGVWHRVTFHPDRTWTLERMPDPFEGTRIAITKSSSRDKAAELARGIRDAATRWCRFADADITTTARGIEPGWQDVLVEDAFTVDSPVSVTVNEDGFHAVLGITSQQQAPVGFYNLGLTLWEGPGTDLPGITFRVKGRHLEHTLTRDSVKRDRHYRRVLRRLRQAVDEQLLPAVTEALIQAGTACDLARIDAILAALPPHTELDRRAAWIPTVDGPLASLDDLTSDAPFLRRLVGRTTPLLMGSPSPATLAVARSGKRVIPADPYSRFARYLEAQLTARYAVSVHELFVVAEPHDADAAHQRLLHHAQHYADAHQLTLHWGVHSDGIALAQHRPFTVEERVTNGWSQPGQHLIIHPHAALITPLLALNSPDAGYVLFRATVADAGLTLAPVAPEAL